MNAAMVPAYGLPYPIRDGRRPVARWLRRRLGLLALLERLAIPGLPPAGAAGETQRAFERITGWQEGSAWGRAS